MFKSAQVLASTTLLCGVLALSGCGASQAGQGAEDTSAHPSASASVKPGTISVASESPSASVAPGSITVVNSASPEHGESSSAHSEESSSENHESKHDHSSSSSNEAKHEGLPPEQSDSNNGEEHNDSDSGNRQGSSSDSGSSSSNSGSSNSSGGNNGGNGNNNGSSSRSDNSGQKNSEGPSQCSMDDLNVSVSVTDNSPGARTLTLYFQNSSDSPCSLRGYPRVIYADSSGNWVGREASNSSEFMNPAGVTIAPGDSTTVVMRSINTSRFGDSCGARQVEGFLVGLAGDRDGVTVPFDTTACSSSVPQLSVGQFGAR